MNSSRKQSDSNLISTPHPRQPGSSRMTKASLGKVPSAIGLVLLSLSGLAAASPGPGNLLVNPGFEGGMSGWNILSANAGDVSYGSAEVASLAVSTQIGGGNRLLRDMGNGTVVEQVVQVGSLPPGTNLRASGYFGGQGNSADDAQLFVIFLNSGGGEIAQRNLGVVSRENRNFETVLMRREGLFSIPAGTDSIAARIEFRRLSCCSSVATADSISLELTTNSLIPNALPLDSELLINPGFEAGWSGESPLTLVDVQGWEGLNGFSRTRPYSDADPETPSALVSAAIAGQGRLLADSSRGASLRQRLDVRGNGIDIANGLAFRVAAFLGGFSSTADNARVEIRFLKSNLTLAGTPVGAVGPVTVENRNAETVVMFKEREYMIPLDTAYIDVEVHFTDLSCCTAWGLLDNISAQLGAPTPITPLPLNVNVVHNGSFENGSLPGSPLVLTDPGSWFGTNSETVELLVYGASPEVPDGGFASMNQLGGVLLSDLSRDGVLSKEFSLEGHGASIAAGNLFLDANVWLGGFSTTQDDAQLNITFFKANQAQAGVQQTLGPVSVAERGGLTTLIEKPGTLLVPAQAVSFRIDARFRDQSCCTGWGLLDGVSIVLRDVGQLGGNYCSSNMNSSGFPAAISATGSNSVGANDLVLSASTVPAGANGLFFYGPNQASIPFGDGFLCVTGSVQRLAVVTADGSGLLTHAVDYAVTAGTANAITAGSTWDFQAWFRDVPAGGAGWNLSDGLEITFQP